MQFYTMVHPSPLSFTENCILFQASNTHFFKLDIRGKGNFLLLIFLAISTPNSGLT